MYSRVLSSVFGPLCGVVAWRPDWPAIMFQAVIPWSAPEISRTRCAQWRPS